MTAPSEPIVSVGLAVRNDPDGVRHAIESVLSQDLADIELVICDNASDDGTVDTLNEYARQDRRVSVSVNPVNIGSHENMNRVYDLSSGRLFRWISADDWLEPHALSTCARALEGRPDAVGVTTGFTVHESGKPPRFEDYPGAFPTSPDASRRFERMLWFFHAGDAKYDPSYAVYRREAMQRSRRLRPNERTDWLMCAEMALMGPILHVPERLAHRSRRESTGPVDRAAFRRRLDPSQGERLKTSPTGMTRELYAMAQAADLTDAQMRRCRKALAQFWLMDVKRVNRIRLSDAYRRARAR